MQTEKCDKIHESSRSRPNSYQLFSHFKSTDERTPTEFPLCQRENDHIIKRLPDSLTIREQRTLMVHVSLRIYVTRHDILCPNAVKRDVGKTRCKSDVIYASALCCAICTSLSVIC